MKIEELDKFEKQIKPIIEPIIKQTDFLDYLPFGSDAHCKQQNTCYFCKYSLSFYDDVDIICAIGFAGNEHICPIVQSKTGIKLQGFDDELCKINEVIGVEE